MPMTLCQLKSRALPRAAVEERPRLDLLPGPLAREPEVDAGSDDEEEDELDQPVMARATGRPSPSTAIQRCQARSALMNRRMPPATLAEHWPV